MKFSPLCLLIAFSLFSCQNSNSPKSSLTDTTAAGTLALDTKKAEKPVKQLTKDDSLQLKSLKQFFTFKTDEFDTGQKTWIKPKDSPKFINQNGIYVYFETDKGVANNLRFSIQYYSDSWLFINLYQFSIDGKAYEYSPNKVETDSGDGGHIWEWFDEQVDGNSKEILQALVKSKTAKVKMNGKQYFDVKKITPKQIASIKRTLDLYTLLGGI